MAEREGLFRTSMYFTPSGPASLFKIVPDNFVEPSVPRKVQQISSPFHTKSISYTIRLFGPHGADGVHDIHYIHVDNIRTIQDKSEGIRFGRTKYARRVKTTDGFHQLMGIH